MSHFGLHAKHGKTWQKTVIAKLFTCQYQQIVEVAHPEAKNATSKAVSKFKAMTAKKGKSILLICLLKFQYKKSIESIEKVETNVIDSAGSIHELKQSPLFWCGACRRPYGFDQNVHWFLQPNQLHASTWVSIKELGVSIASFSSFSHSYPLML